VDAYKQFLLKNPKNHQHLLAQRKAQKYLQYIKNVNEEHRKSQTNGLRTKSVEIPAEAIQK